LQAATAEADAAVSSGPRPQFGRPAEVVGATREVAFAAWAPVGSLTNPPGSSPITLPRIQLPKDRRLWPAPPGLLSWYAGV
jgi:hypothetical protein